MEFNVKNGSIEKQRTGCVIVGVYETRRFSESAEELDRLSEGYLSNILRKGDLDGKVGQTLLLHHVPNVPADRAYRTPIQTTHTKSGAGVKRNRSN